MKQGLKHIAFSAVMIAAVLTCILFYGAYTQRMIDQESTRDMLAVYEQVNKTFNMFAQRNWNILSNWADELEKLSHEEENGGDSGASVARRWSGYIDRKTNWQYSEVVLFNQNRQYLTVSGRSGEAPHMTETVKELYAADGPIVSSYISSKGVREVMFAQRVHPIAMDGVVYDALVICYDNSTLENMIGGLAFEGRSDCYIVRANGEVVLSTEPKTALPQTVDNLFAFLEQNTNVSRAQLDSARAALLELNTGSLRFRLNDGETYYLVYQPVGFRGWSIVGIVPTGAVDSGMNATQSTTILLLMVLFGIILVGIARIIRDGVRMQQERAEMEKRELERSKEQSDQMFQGITRIVERFAVCDLDADHYEHHERKHRGLYPPEGSFHWLVEQISQRYVVMTEGVNVEMRQMLDPDHLRNVLRDPEDMLTFEYAARDKSCFLLMNVVPCGWEDGRLTRVMMMSQDMGRQHLLEDMANTDGLTGLLNKRYFDTLLAGLCKQGRPFALFCMDLDRFKLVNDTYGHVTGDKLLCQVANRLHGCIRTTDYAARLGGDEFALLLIGELTKDTCSRKAQLIRERIGAAYPIDGRDIVSGTSCGWARYPAEGSSAEQLYVLADERMYQDKKRHHARQGIKA